eukprot:Rhum_TRINITY_DN12501_c0_g1::Rhum_TRINITY_DN12501_c0_g1_i1::g.52376::m.52376
MSMSMEVHFSADTAEWCEEVGAEGNVRHLRELAFARLNSTFASHGDEGEDDDPLRVDDVQLLTCDGQSIDDDSTPLSAVGGLHGGGCQVRVALSSEFSARRRCAALSREEPGLHLREWLTDLCLAMPEPVQCGVGGCAVLRHSYGGIFDCTLGEPHVRVLAAATGTGYVYGPDLLRAACARGCLRLVEELVCTAGVDPDTVEGFAWWGGGPRCAPPCVESPLTAAEGSGQWAAAALLQSLGATRRTREVPRPDAAASAAAAAAAAAAASAAASPRRQLEY